MLHEALSRTMGMLGHRNVVLLSPGFLTVTQPQQQGAASLIERAIKGGVTVSAVDVRGLKSGGVVDSNEALAIGSTMADLAYGTGGTYFHNNNDVGEGIRRATEPPAYTYFLGFFPQRMDNRFHKLRIRVKGTAKYSVQTRSGYYSLKPLPSPSATPRAERPSGPLAFFPTVGPS